MFNIEKFVRLGNVVLELTRLLKMKFIEGNKHINHPIGKTIRSILMLSNNGDNKNAELELARLEFLVLHLKRIENYDKKLLKRFRNDIIKMPENFLGIRFEIGIAASLIKKEINFNKQESPDFKLIEEDYPGVYIECGSSRLSITKEGDILDYKISSVINKKGKKKYANYNTALFIDVTNLIWNYEQGNGFIEDIKDKVKRTIPENLKSNQFGNITLFSYVMNPDLKSYESNYIRIDSENINHNLLNFLNQYYPILRYRIKNPILPSEA